MPNYPDTTYTPPSSYQLGHKDADEADDLRYLHASAAVIKIGTVPVVAIENLNISQQVNRTPIYVVGALAPIGFDVQGISVNVSGQMVQMANMSLNQSIFYSKNEAEIIANINKVFHIEIVMMDYTKGDPDDETTSGLIETQAFLKVMNCQNTGSNITINPNTNMKDSFTAVGTFMIRNFAVLKDFNIAAEEAAA